MNIVSNVEEYKVVLKKINNNFISNLYIVKSEELFFLNDFTSQIKKIIPDELKDLNQYIFYGNEIKIEDVIINAKKFPMLGEKQLIIIKDASKVFKKIEYLNSHIESIPKSTILVFCLEGVSINYNKSEIKSLISNGSIYDFKKIYDNKMSSWIKYLGERRGFNLNYKTCELIRERTGNSLSKIDIELEKISLNIKNNEIDDDIIIEHFGVNNDFNLFELQNEIGKRNFKRVFMISNYFTNNSSYSIQQILSTLHNYFTNIFQIHSLRNKNPQSLSKNLGLNYYFINDYINASKNYNINDAVKIIRIIKKYDLKSKGINYEGNSNKLINQLVAEIKS
tara:strand:- start:2612 stop:3622 length:1011 start_codon:yes stop_codon:yes gene_type:complete